jgi:endonuclease/exonuclease/phosphatase family metal-dependent hydrolase
MCAADQFFLIGDLNAVKAVENRVGNPLTLSEMRDLSELITDIHLAEINSSGGYFSWTSKGIGNRVQSRIDWAFGNDVWMLHNSHVKVDYLLPSVSDHTPLLIKYCDLKLRENHSSSLIT